MLRSRVILLIYCYVYFYVNSVSAGYTSEETDEKSKSLYNSVTTILGTTDTSRHHYKHSYDGPPQAPCGKAAVECPNIVSTNAGEVYPCDQPSGCPLSKTNTNDGRIVGPSPDTAVGHSPSGYNGVAYDTRPSVALAGSVTATGYKQSGYIGGPYGGVQGQPRPPSPPQSGYGIGYPAPYGSYGPPAATPGAYGYYHQPPPPPAYGHPAYYGYQGERGYTVLDHSLKTNSEYTETGNHNGPLQQANNGFGYGSGYGGYMGMYNRPGF